MARKISEIYDELIAEKNSMSQLNALQPSVDSSQQLLSDVTSSSAVADWRLWLWIMAFATWVIELKYDKLKEEIAEIIANKYTHGTQWYVTQALAFQYGDSLQWINNNYQYSPIDDTKMIVKRAAVVEANGQVIIKIAKLQGLGVVPLTSNEVDAFEAYIHQVKDAGVNTLVISNSADLFKAYFTIYYDPLVMNPDGSLINDSSVFPVEDAITSYLSNIEFNGKIILTKLVDQVQLATGVKNPVLNHASAKFGGNPYQLINVEYQTDAGYITLDPAVSLSSTLTYIPYV